MQMTTTGEDRVTRVIKYCVKDHALAEKFFDTVATKNGRTLKLPDGEITLSDDEAGEFVQRYSSEVEPTIWVSKRRK